MLEHTAQGGGWVSVRGDVQEMFRCYTKEHGVVGKYWLYVTMKIFSNLCDNVVLILSRNPKSPSSLLQLRLKSI